MLLRVLQEDVNASLDRIVSGPAEASKPDEANGVLCGGGMPQGRYSSPEVTRGNLRLKS